MKIEYPLNYKQFAGVKFINTEPASGNRIKLDPKDFNELQDLWLQHIDDFIKAVRGNDAGIISGCEVHVQEKQNINGTETLYEVVVVPGNVYVNAALIKVVFNHALDIPSVEFRNWDGFKLHYLVLVPEIREFTPTQLGEPGMSALAGRTTSHRMEIGFNLGLVDEIPNAPPINSPAFTDALMSSNSLEELTRKHNVPWFVVLAEVKIRNIISGLDDIIVDTSNVSHLKVMNDIQEIATSALTGLQKHLLVSAEKKELIGAIDGVNKKFAFPEGAEVLQGGESDFVVYLNNEAIEDTFYEFIRDEAWQTSDKQRNSCHILFFDAPSENSIVAATYLVDQHPQYLSNLVYSKHIETVSTDHDNRYYTRAEDDGWRLEHDTSSNSHPTHMTHAFFNNWSADHTGDKTVSHDNVYTRINHKHFIGDTHELQDNLLELSQSIGYNNEDYYIISQEIFQGINGQNRIFPINNELLDDGFGYIKNVRADISNDAVKNPVMLSVVDASEDYLTDTSAYSVGKTIAHQRYNRKPCVAIQSDNEIWSFWVSTDFNIGKTEIWFSSYCPSLEVFSPALSTGLKCLENSHIAATVVTSIIPTIDQRVVMVWDADDIIYYTYVEQGQTDWTTHIVELPNTRGYKEPCILWVADGSALGKLHLTYRRLASSGKWSIYRRMFEIDLTEFGSETLLSDSGYDCYSPIILQDKTSLTRVWYGWIKQEKNRENLDYDNSGKFEAIVFDKLGLSVHLPIFNVANLNLLNIKSSVSWACNATGIRLQYSVLLGNVFESFYVELTNNGTALGEPIQFLVAQNQTVLFSRDNIVWIIYDYLGTILYKTFAPGMGSIKWNRALKYIEFQYAPVDESVIWIDVAVPIRSLNSRISNLEGQKADDQEVLAVKIREAIASMGLGFPLERLASLREKIIVESKIEMNNRLVAYGYDHVFYEKFFASVDNESRIPFGCSLQVLKGGRPSVFETSGLEFDDMGKVTNNTGQIIKFYSTVRHLPNFFSNGYIMLEARGENNLDCLEFRITSNMDIDPFANTISWQVVAKENFGKELLIPVATNFTDTNNFGIEITLLPGGWIYDWALFLRKKVV